MDKDARIFVAGHRGLVGSALVKSLRAGGWNKLLLRTSSELDLRDEAATEAFFAREKPQYVFLAAAKVSASSPTRAIRSSSCRRTWRSRTT